LHRWFSWDGRADSLWSQSVKPILDPREMGASARLVAGLMSTDPTLGCLYERVFGPAAADDERRLVNVGKALAAFLETIRSGRTTFDDFRDALARGDMRAAAGYPLAARRGLRIFVGPGNCGVCHFGPHFSNGEFHDVGVPFLLAPGRVDAGRHGSIKQLRADRFNLLGPYSDDATRASATRTRHVELQHANYGQFRTRRSATSPSPRPTCTMGGTPPSATSSATTPRSTWSGCTPTASSSCVRWRSRWTRSTTSSRSWRR
jgi:cytochrome c peroxidase